MNLFARIADLFERLKYKPLDKLILHLGMQHVSLWNGVNYSREFMFFYKRGTGCTPSLYPYLKIKLGEYTSGYGDWGGGFDRCVDSVVDIYIDDKWIIRHIDRKDGFYNGPKPSAKFEKKTDKLLKKIKVGDKFETYLFSALNPFIIEFFSHPVEARYNSIISAEKIVFIDAEARNHQFRWWKESCKNSAAERE